MIAPTILRVGDEAWLVEDVWCSSTGVHDGALAYPLLVEDGEERVCNECDGLDTWDCTSPLCLHGLERAERKKDGVTEPLPPIRMTPETTVRHPENATGGEMSTKTEGGILGALERAAEAVSHGALPESLYTADAALLRELRERLEGLVENGGFYCIVGCEALAEPIRNVVEDIWLGIVE